MKKSTPKTVAVLKPAQKSFDAYEEQMAQVVEMILQRRAYLISAKKDLEDAERKLIHCHDWPLEATKQHRDKVQEARSSINTWESAVARQEQTILEELPWWPCLFPVANEAKTAATVHSIQSPTRKRHRAVSK